MAHLNASTPGPDSLLARTESAARARSGADGNAHLYVLVVMSFYGVFLCGIMLGYFRSKRREKRRVNVFTRLVHEEEQREWGALPRKRSLVSAHGAALALPCGNHGNQPALLRHEGPLPAPLACALCTEQSSVSSLCSSADTRLTIEEESDSGSAEGPEETLKSEHSGDDSG